MNIYTLRFYNIIGTILQNSDIPLSTALSPVIITTTAFKNQLIFVAQSSVTTRNPGQNEMTAYPTRAYHLSSIGDVLKQTGSLVDLLTEAYAILYKNDGILERMATLVIIDRLWYTATFPLLLILQDATAHRFEELTDDLKLEAQLLGWL